MHRAIRFLRDTSHLWILLAIIVSGGAGFLWARSKMIPESFGERGPYRATAIAEIAAFPITLPSDRACQECHKSVADERAESLHVAVRCFHCHGSGQEHMALARKAAASGNVFEPEASEWDGNFFTDIDLFVTQDRATCLACHESQVGMPADFKQIVVADHLEEMDAEEATSRQVCFECHGGHDTAP